MHLAIGDGFKELLLWSLYALVAPYPVWSQVLLILRKGEAPRYLGYIQGHLPVFLKKIELELLDTIQEELIEVNRLKELPRK
jgi:hypothetical protein